MTNLLLRVAAIFILLGSVSIGHADEVRGRIAIVDHDERSVTLTNGMTFNVEDEIPIEDLIPGDDVSIEFEEEGGELFAVKLLKLDREA